MALLGRRRVAVDGALAADAVEKPDEKGRDGKRCEGCDDGQHARKTRQTGFGSTGNSGLEGVPARLDRADGTNQSQIFRKKLTIFELSRRVLHAKIAPNQEHRCRSVVGALRLIGTDAIWRFPCVRLAMLGVK